MRSCPSFVVVNLRADYRQQYGYRDWARIFEALPDITGQRVLDLGCGIGDQAAALAARGAQVIGIDANEELLAEAHSRRIEHAEFRLLNLNEAFVLDTMVDGIWCSFAAAYFPNLSENLKRWGKHLRPGGWIALTEIDDMFGHEPLTERCRRLLESYVQESLAAGRYDFRMGSKLRWHLEVAGFEHEQEFCVRDHELAFDGRAGTDVLASWRNRLERMKLLQVHCGSDFELMREDFLGCLARDDHRAHAKVCCVVARRADPG